MGKGESAEEPRNKKWDSHIATKATGLKGLSFSIKDITEGPCLDSQEGYISA